MSKMSTLLAALKQQCEIVTSNLALAQSIYGCRAQSVVDKIFSVIRELAGGNKTVKLSEIREQCTSKGYQPDHVEECIEQYEELNVWQVNQARTTITFV